MQRKKLLIFPFNLLSHYLRCISLAKSYPEYDVWFASSAEYDSFVKRAGFNTFNVESFDPVKVMACSRVFDFKWLNEQDIFRVYRSQVNAIRELNPELVLGDTSPTLKMASEHTHVKYVALMNGYMTKYYSRVRKVSRTHYSYQYVSRLPNRVGDFITSFAEQKAFKAIHQPFRVLRKKLNLKKISSYLDELEGDENLICDDPDLFPQKNMPTNYRFIGSLFYVSNDREKVLLSALDHAKPTICVSMGSSGDWDKFSFLSADRYNFLNIIVAGDLRRTIKGDHIYYKEFVNLDEVLPYCRLLVCHGGNGTICLGIKHKVPMLCLTSHFEQEWNVQMLEEKGFGELINEAPQPLVDKAVMPYQPVSSAVI